MKIAIISIIISAYLSAGQPDNTSHQVDMSHEPLASYISDVKKVEQEGFHGYVALLKDDQDIRVVWAHRIQQNDAKPMYVCAQFIVDEGKSKVVGLDPIVFEIVEHIYEARNT